MQSPLALLRLDAGEEKKALSARTETAFGTRIAESQLSRYEKGRVEPSNPTVRTLAAAYDITPAAFYRLAQQIRDALTSAKGRYRNPVSLVAMLTGS